jgi:hypothetical protein
MRGVFIYSREAKAKGESKGSSLEKNPKQIQKKYKNKQNEQLKKCNTRGTISVSRTPRTRVGKSKSIQDAGVTQLVECHLAKVDVESSNLFSRSR